MQVLITGGAGWVGRHFVKRLCDDGHDVVVVDDLSTGLSPKDWAFPPRDETRLTFFGRDCREFFKQYPASSFDLIIHCAAVVGGRLKIEGDPLVVATDLAIDSDFFRWTAQSRPELMTKNPKIIYFSSSAVYPIADQTRHHHLPLVEATVDLTRSFFGMPDQTYGWSKLTGELLAQHAVKTYGLNVIIYRPFSGYGEDQDESYPFPAIIRRVVNREDPIVIWGSGEQLRDFIHIDDVVEAVMVTKDVLKAGEVLNLGRGIDRTFHDIVAIALAQEKINAKVVYDATKPEGVFARVADVTKMNQFYTPKILLPEGVQRSLDHARR